jgi:hypothetical protein
MQFPKRRVSLVCFLNTRTMDRVRKPNISESYTPSSESYSNHERWLDNFGGGLVLTTSHRKALPWSEMSHKGSYIN